MALKNFSATIPVPETIAGVPFTVFRVVNGGDATIKGAELAGQYIFNNGFGVVANLTTTTSTANLGDLARKLPEVIPHSYNLKLLYEKYGWSNQITYSYTSSYTQTFNGSAGVSVLSDPFKELDATISYEFAKHYTAFMEGTNLLDQREYAYHTYRNVPAQLQLPGRFIFLGMRARL